MANPKKLQILGSLGGKGTVKSVNGVQPDETGNVLVDIPKGFSGSWNDLADKPFEEVTVITETPVRENISFTPSSVYTYSSTYGFWPQCYKQYRVVWDGTEYFCEAIGIDIVTLGTASSDGTPFKFAYDTRDPAGAPWVYVTEESVGKTHTYSAYKRNMTTTITTLDEKYIPDDIARADDIPTDNHINSLIDTKLGVIENGSY